LLILPTRAHAQYRLKAGDTLEVSVTGLPDLRQRATIGLDGEIALPLAGGIKIAGLTVAEARLRIVRGFTDKVYHQQGADGRDIQRLIVPDEIVVSAVEYRPIYVAGDVARPGEYVFRAGITVRHAVTLAGGYDLMRLRLGDPFLQAADFQAEYAALWAEYQAEQSRMWRLRVELGEVGAGDQMSSEDGPMPSSFSARLEKVESGTLQATLADRESDKAALQAAINKAAQQMNTLVEKKKNDEEGNQADMADFLKVKELFQKGMTPTTRLADARRAVQLSSNQLLQTIVEMSNLERQRDDYSRQVAKIESQRRIDNWKELQQSNLRLAQIAARLKSARNKLSYAGLLASQSAEQTERRVKVTIFRRTDEEVQRLAATEDRELAPGDVVEVTLERPPPMSDVPLGH
jgi:polysaccharide export outer membrane protein